MIFVGKSINKKTLPVVQCMSGVAILHIVIIVMISYTSAICAQIVTKAFKLKCLFKLNPELFASNTNPGGAERVEVH